ncbi:hypothetical protein N836_15165 [Leptolyngbya sp. Heron Island J]|nr:hypothetical protein N836_15165 [Leptolyngbya sp. Heron Island J]
MNGIYLALSEDVVLNKLRWRRDNQSAKQWRAVLEVLKVQGTALELDD